VANDVRLRFTGDTSDLNRAMADGESRASKFGKAMGGIAKGAAVGVGGAALLLGTQIKAGIGGLMEGEEAEAKFADALERSNKVMKGQEDLAKKRAEQLQKATKFSYEDGLAIAAVVAQQESLSDAVKRGTTDTSELIGISANLATVMGVDAKKAAELLAKAMAKPEGASKLLQQAGVDLSNAEEKKIKALVKSGKTVEAQTFLLDKLGEKTRGAADAAGNTLAGKIERAKNAFGELQEMLAAKVLPAVTWVIEKALELFQGLGDGEGKMGKFRGALDKVASFVSNTVIPALMDAKRWFVDEFLPAAKRVGEWLVEKLTPAFNAIGEAVREQIVPALKRLKERFDEARPNLEWFLKQVVKIAGFLLEDVLPVLVKVGGFLVRHVVRNVELVIGAFSGMIGMVREVIDWVDKLISKAGPIADLAGKVGGFAGKVGGVFGKLPGFANGGVPQGASIVGERGPELFVPATAGRVLSASDTMRTLRGGGGHQTVTLRIDGSNKELRDLMRKIVRTDGNGNVNVAFGGRA
jgi:hypothetical protein